MSKSAKAIRSALFSPIPGNFLKYSINRIVAGGETNFYGPLIKALSILKKEDTSNYTTTIVLMTDGQSDKNYYEEFMNYYKYSNL